MMPKISPMEVAYLLAVHDGTGTTAHSNEDAIKNLKARGFLTSDLK